MRTSLPGHSTSCLMAPQVPFTAPPHFGKNPHHPVPNTPPRPPFPYRTRRSASEYPSCPHSGLPVFQPVCSIRGFRQAIASSISPLGFDLWRASKTTSTAPRPQSAPVPDGLGPRGWAPLGAGIGVWLGVCWWGGGERSVNCAAPGGPMGCQLSCTPAIKHVKGLSLLSNLRTIRLLPRPTTQPSPHLQLPTTWPEPQQRERWRHLEPASSRPPANWSDIPPPESLVRHIFPVTQLAIDPSRPHRPSGGAAATGDCQLCRADFGSPARSSNLSQPYHKSPPKKNSSPH